MKFFLYIPLAAALCCISVLSHALGRNEIVRLLCFPGIFILLLVYIVVTVQTIHLIGKLTRLVWVQMRIGRKCCLDFFMSKLLSYKIRLCIQF